MQSVHSTHSCRPLISTVAFSYSKRKLDIA
jgi:hypothetical protein